MQLTDNPFTLMESSVSQGEALAEGKWKPFVEGLEGLERVHTAKVLENTHQWLSRLDETVRAVHIGNFDRFAFPLVRTVFPNLVAQELVSVQPMDGPVGQVFYFDLIYGSNKGRIRQGSPAFSSKTGHPGDDFYAAPEVKEEPIANGTGSATQFDGSLDWTPVLPGTLLITDGSMEVQDDGKGNLVGDIDPAGSNSIDYASGAFNVTFATAPASGSPITADYEYDNEANSQVPEMDIQLTSMPVVAKVFKIRARNSLEAAQNANALHGLSVQTEVLVGMAQELRFEIDRIIIRDVNQLAQATAVSWPMMPTTGVSWTEHKLSLVDKFIEGSNNIFAKTRRGHPNWAVVGLKVANVIESLPGFRPSADLSNPVGVINAGTLNGRWKIFKDPYNIDGSASQRNFLIGYKGATFLEAGYVYAPYIPFYVTPNVVLDDFIERRGMATQWAKRRINGRFYARGIVTGEFAA